MLVLTRRLDEEIVIGDDVRVRVVDIRKDQIKLGIQAPKGMRVDRKEIHELRREDANGREPQS